jgi:hypothetical protein
MANHNLWVSLSINEKRIMTNKLLHLIQNSAVAFNMACKIIEAAEELGKFDGVSFDIGTPEPINSED